jgi:hypothetical protein
MSIELFPISEKTSFQERFHVSHLFPSGRSNMEIKMLVKNWKNDIDRENRHTGR